MNKDYFKGVMYDLFTSAAIEEVVLFLFGLKYVPLLVVATVCMHFIFKWW